MFQEYACTGVGWGVRPRRIFEHRVGWGVQNWPFWGVRTLWMAPYPICMYCPTFVSQTLNYLNQSPYKSGFLENLKSSSNPPGTGKFYIENLDFGF